jgi:hypothetical protein
LRLENVETANMRCNKYQGLIPAVYILRDHPRYT